MDQISICKDLTKRNEINPFLKQMVTGDEKWVTFHNIVRKLSWSKRGEAAQTVVKPGLTARKLLLLIDQKWPELANGRGVVFHQDNARPHASAVSQEPLGACGWEVLMLPPYSSDPARSDYHLFLTLQNLLSDKKLGSREDCENRLLDVFANKGQDFYERDITKLSLKWQQIIQQNGAYLTQIGQSEAC
ncbi:histone-lysine N-methyltransferase SETMAR [Trichonephila clavipes]|nr:histone-lysine N-methyltransferase SETMAR [Trichonephila clavipes]